MADTEMEENAAETQGVFRRVGRGAARAVTAPLRNYVNRQFLRMDESWKSRMHPLQDWLLGDIEAAAELTATHARTLTLLNQRLDQLNERLDQLDRRLDRLAGSEGGTVRGRPLADAPGEAASPRASRER